MNLEPNVLFDDRYRLIEMKGRGTFGEVWLAHDEQIDLDVALKAYIALDDRGVDEFRTEYRNAIGLNHPNLLHANHFALCEKRPYLVMPFCPGSAAKLVGNVDEATMWRFIRDVSAGLAYLHEMDVVHHDIKPDNILMDVDNNFLITDFGISTKMRSTLRRNSARDLSESKALGGSISYMGPEMFAAKAESVKATDIWALGATLYEMVTGELPFFGQGGVMQMNGAQMPEIYGDFSDDFKQVVKMCLAKDPWERPQASQLKDYAQAKMNGQTLPDYGGMTPPQPSQPQSQPQGSPRSTVMFNSGGLGYNSNGNGGYNSNGNGGYNSGGYNSNGGGYNSNGSGTGTVLEGSEVPTPKKKKKGVGVIIGIVAALIVAAVVVFVLFPKESPEVKRAKENVPTYNKLVESCQTNINKGTYENYKPLLTAREELNQVKQLEDQGKAYDANTYNHYANLNNQLDSKCNEIGRKYEELALEFIELDEQQALDNFEIVRQLIPAFNSPEYQKIKKNK